ncbi:MAG TPA: hypothetical protein DEH22_05240 [Chloroflexi bacterium]|nr:hypothetical protein [Chloroflexota bacterium]
MFPVIQIGPLSLQAPGLILILGVWVGLVIAERSAPRFRANPNHIYNLVFVILVAGLLGARLSFVLQNLEAFLQSPLNVFSLNPGLLDPWGGLAVGLLAALIYTNRQQIPLWTLLDALTPFLSVMLIAWGLSNLASGKAFGTETQLIWGIDLWGTTRHPTQIYQMIAGATILGIIWPSKKTTNPARVPGETFGLFLSLSAGAWLLTETFRGDSVVLPNGLRVAQVAAWLMLAVSLWGWGKLRKRKPPEIPDSV